MWFLCQRKDAKPRDEWTVGLPEHLAWMKKQHDLGLVYMSGPAPGRGMSMYLIRAASESDAQALASQDPFTSSGQCTFDLIHWEVHQIMGAGPFSKAEIAATKGG